ALPIPQRESPPANRPSHFLRVPNSLIQNLGAFEVEPKPDLRYSLLLHGVTQARLVAGIEHKEAASARANNFSAQGAIAHGVIVPGVDVLVTHAPGSLFLVLPMNIHEPRKFAQVICLERGLALQAEF